jgi:hypothetical protein
MDNFDLKKYLGNNPLLKEIKINSPGGRLFPEKYLADLDAVTESYLESSSPEDILTPQGEEYSLENMADWGEDDRQLIALQNIINNVPPGVYFIKNWILGVAPGAPKHSFDTKITIKTPGSMLVETPGISDDGDNAGWFNASGKYYPDLENFNEDGSRLNN